MFIRNLENFLINRCGLVFVLNLNAGSKCELSVLRPIDSSTFSRLYCILNRQLNLYHQEIGLCITIALHVDYVVLTGAHTRQLTVTSYSNVLAHIYMHIYDIHSPKLMSNSVSIAKKTETKKHPTNKPTIAIAIAIATQLGFKSIKWKRPFYSRRLHSFWH